MANGIAGLRPFPTFGGDKAGGITPVTLAPTTPRFPNVSGRTFTTPPRDDINPLAYLAPVGLSFLADKLFSGKTEPLPVPDKDASDLVQAEYLAEQIYGPRREQTTGQRIGELATQYLPALLTDNDKELAAFINTASSFDKARSDRAKLTDTARQTFIAQQLKDEPDQRVTLIDLDKQKLGIQDIRQGKFDPKKGYFVLNDDKTDYINFLDLPNTNFVDVKVLGETPDFTKLRGKGLTKFDELDKTIQEQDTNTLRFLTSTNRTLDFLEEGIKSPDKNPVTLVANMANAANSVASNFNQIYVMSGGDALFATPEDVKNNTAGGDGRTGTGQNALALVQALQSGNQNEIDAAIKQFDESGAMAATGQYGTIKEALGDIAFANVRTRSLLLQLAYSAAATAGQTGRTLSDKDLAFFLQQIGFGATQDAEVLYSNLVDFAETTIKQNDAGLASTLALGRLPRFKTGDKYSDEMLNLFEFYFNFEDGQNTETYTRKNFADRYGNEEVYKNFIERPRYRKTDGSTTTKDQPENILDFQLNVEDI
jgi:hypothetical protein